MQLGNASQPMLLVPPKKRRDRCAMASVEVVLYFWRNHQVQTNGRLPLFQRFDCVGMAPMCILWGDPRRVVAKTWAQKGSSRKKHFTVS